MRCLGGRARFGIDLSEGPVAADGLQDEVYGRDVCHVSGIRVATTASEETPNSSRAIDDDGAGVALGRKIASLAVEGQNGNISTNIRENIIAATDRQAGSPATLEDHDTGIAVLVIHRRLRISSSAMVPRSLRR